MTHADSLCIEVSFNKQMFNCSCDQLTCVIILISLVYNVSLATTKVSKTTKIENVTEIQGVSEYQSSRRNH